MSEDLNLVEEGLLGQDVEERLFYAIDTTKNDWGGYDSGADVKVYDMAKTDVSDDHLSGDPSVTGDIIMTPLVIALEDDTDYKLKFKWVKDGATKVAYVIIRGKN